MKPEELMIGDIIYNKKLDQRDKIELYYFFSQYNDEWAPFVEEEDYMFNQFEPIFLNPEFLLNNGFVRYEIQQDYYIRRKAYVDEFKNEWNLIVLCSTNPQYAEIRISLNDDEDDIDYNLPDFRFVHEFQHQLRSIGLFDIANSLNL